MMAPMYSTALDKALVNFPPVLEKGARIIHLNKLTSDLLWIIKRSKKGRGKDGLKCPSPVLLLPRTFL